MKSSICASLAASRTCSSVAPEFMRMFSSTLPRVRQVFWNTRELWSLSLIPIFIRSGKSGTRLWRSERPVSIPKDAVSRPAKTDRKIEYVICTGKSDSGWQALLAGLIQFAHATKICWFSAAVCRYWQMVRFFHVIARCCPKNIVVFLSPAKQRGDLIHLRIKPPPISWNFLCYFDSWFSYLFPRFQKYDFMLNRLKLHFYDNWQIWLNSRCV